VAILRHNGVDVGKMDFSVLSAWSTHDWSAGGRSGSIVRSRDSKRRVK